MVGFARLLEEDYGTLPNEKRCDLLHTIAQSGHKMSNIIDELLLLARLRGAEVEMKPLDMASIVAEAWQRLVYMIEEYQAEIILPDAWPVALGHGAWIEEVWANYLSNALKYSGRPPRVELGFSIADLGFPILDSLPMPQPKGIQSKIENQKSKIVYWVRDNGPGLTPEEQARLFTPFTRLDQVRVKGHGLGLSIVRRIVEKLGGEVGVESQVGRGSLFWFTLPAQ
jgi:two-component system sensor histidine kinase/response regulator